MGAIIENENVWQAESVKKNEFGAQFYADLIEEEQAERQQP